MATTVVSLRGQLRELVRSSSELPLLGALTDPIRRQLFRRAFRSGNDYYGVYDSFEDAKAAARALSTTALPPDYDVEAAGRMYRDQLDRIRATDYPLVFWLARLFAQGNRRVFDLGGNIGVSYYGFDAYLDYPREATWTVHDVPSVMAMGRAFAARRDLRHQLAFADSAQEADGCDVLMSSGALQYLDYGLPDLLRAMVAPPRHVLLNLTPMHPERGYFTLQNIGIAICPYRVMRVDELVGEMEKLGYAKRDHWQSAERSLRVPRAPACTVDAYHGFHFERTARSATPHEWVSTQRK